MAIISIIITESTDQVLSGIPKTISLTANTPSTIFYTLDGSDPDTSSFVYTSTFLLPTTFPKLIIKIFATNGTDSSAIITRSYEGNVINDTRLPHAGVVELNNNNIRSPFSSGSVEPNAQYLNTSKAGITVDDPEKASIYHGFDGDGNQAIPTDLPLDQYKQIYSTTNSIGEQGNGIGTLPSITTLIGKNTPVEYNQEESNRSDRLFNPRAMVIFQDASAEGPNDVSVINRQYFNLQNTEITRDGALLYNASLDSPSITGSLLKSYYNQRTNEVTNYYFDSGTNRWIISKYQYEPKNKETGKLYSMVFPRKNEGAGRVFQWHLFKSRYLF